MCSYENLFANILINYERFILFIDTLINRFLVIQNGEMRKGVSLHEAQLLKIIFYFK